MIAPIWIIFGVFMLLSWLISMQLRSKFKKYSKVPINYNLTGKEVAEKMLKDNGIMDVKVVSTPGQLSDHYNPMTKTVNLSEGVYSNSNVAAAAVAAHECGHAVQHATAYSFLQMRSKLVPVVSFTSVSSSFKLCLPSYLSALFFLASLPCSASLPFRLRLMPQKGRWYG
jgi:Zn-dependent membrane protease YugP